MTGPNTADGRTKYSFMCCLSPSLCRFYNGRFLCSYEMAWYPFDIQHCRLVLSIRYCYLAAMPLRYSANLPLRYSDTLFIYCSVTLLLCYSSTLLLCYSATLGLCYSVTLLLCYWANILRLTNTTHRGFKLQIHQIESF